MKNFLSQSGKRGCAKLLAALIVMANLFAPVAGEAGADGRNIESLATRRVQPAYPPMAQKYRIEGTVTVEVTVSSDGKVSKAEFVRGHNIFRSVSLDAATCHHS
jgi:hypothetical protein